MELAWSQAKAPKARHREFQEIEIAAAPKLANPPRLTFHPLAGGSRIRDETCQKCNGTSLEWVMVVHFPKQCQRAAAEFVLFFTKYFPRRKPNRQPVLRNFTPPRRRSLRGRASAECPGIASTRSASRGDSPPSTCTIGIKPCDKTAYSPPSRGFFLHRRFGILAQIPLFV
jgi:hypothetical protein